MNAPFKPKPAPFADRDQMIAEALAAIDAQVKPLGNGRWVPIWDSTGGTESNPINGRTK